MKPIFSVLIPALNSRSTLELALRCLDAQTLPNDQFECLIVDDGSTDGTSTFLRRYRSAINLRHFFHPTNRGRSQARNTACARAEGNIFIFIDADMLPAPDWLANYAAAFAQAPSLDVISGGRYHVHLGANPDYRPLVLGQMLGVSPGELFVTQTAEQFGKLRASAQLGMYPGHAMAKIEAQLPEVCRQYPTSLLCAYSLITSNVAVRKNAFEKTGGFDASMQRTEDTDMGIRLWSIGARFGCAPDARAYHMYHSGQGDHANTLVERQAFFYRNPYLLVILLNLWFAYHDQPDPTPPSPIFDSLLTLLAAEKELPDIDIRQEFYRIYRQAAWADCVCDKDFMAEFYGEHSGIPRDKIEAYLDQAIAQGLVVQQRNQRYYFDFDHTTNWLRKNTTYQQYELECTRYNWIRNWIPYPHDGTAPRPEERNGVLRRPPLTLRCRGIYEVSIPQEALPEGPVEATINLPLPAEHACQTNVRIVRCEPESLLDYADGERTMISGFPLAQALKDGEITLRYEFECNLQEHLLAKTGDEPASIVDNAQYLKPTYPAAQLPRAEALLKKILAGSVQDSYSIAHTLYSWILNNRRYLQSFLPDYLIMETGFGPCVHMARLFVNFCRLMRIPAREQCGALFGRALTLDNPQRTVVTGRAYNILTHTWAEFYTPQRGWTPVEFSAADLGRHTLTATNVEDECLREQLIRETDQYSAYYFGNLDPFRIHSSEQAGQAPTYPLVKSRMTPNTLKNLLLQTRHRLVCDVSGTAGFSDLWAGLQTVRAAARPNGDTRLNVIIAQDSERIEPHQPEASSSSPQRIIITSIGSTGDVQPLLALADELRNAGHELVFALPSMYQNRIESLGFRFAKVGAGTGVDAWHKIFARQAEITDPIEQTRYFVEALVPWMPRMFQELRALCSEADILIGPTFQLAARMVHDATGIPFVSVHFSPFGSKGNKALREISAPLVNQVRQQAGLLPLTDPLGADGASPQLALYAVSRHVFRPPAGWATHHHLTGYWFFDEATWQPDPALVEFIQAGEPPVVVTFGSMPSDDPVALTDLILAAIKQAGCRAIIQRGGGDLARSRALPENIRTVDFVPHGWLFPRAACVVHHGGAGTTAAAFRAGVPTVVAPHLLDQPIWAEYARALGCAGAVIPHAQLTAAQLSAAITQTLSHPRYRRSAARLGEQIRAENGAQTARKLIEKEFATPKVIQ
jgi:UDP:flavonoid glycosyltransferase YjiC (YdhE family)/GT2 family glycosyltransferase/transglutaminase-like putative cysteine protease